MRGGRCNRAASRSDQYEAMMRGTVNQAWLEYDDVDA